MTSTNLIVQYVCVGVAALAAIIYIVRGFIRRHKKGSDGCCGCSLGDTCADRSRKRSRACDKKS